MPSEKSVAGRISSPGAVTALRRVAIDFDGPYRSENPATFRDFRFDLELTNLQNGDAMVAPGYFAADGRAGETGASSGSVWRACFAPPSEGVWRYRARLRRGADVALQDPATPLDAIGEGVDPVDGLEGVLDVGKAGRPGPTPEGAIDLSAAGALEEGPGRLRIPRVEAERPLMALGNWRALLASDAFDAPVCDADGQPLIKASSFGAGSVAGAAMRPYFGALRLVEIMAAAAAEKGAGLIRLDLFPAEASARAVGPWKEAVRNGREAVDPFSFDISRLQQWEALLERLAARGLAIELRIDPPDPAESAAFWRELVALPVRRLLLRELSARFAGLGAVIWRGGLGPEDRAYAAALDPRRSAAGWGDAAPSAYLEDAGAAGRGASSQSQADESAERRTTARASAIGPAAPPEPPAVATRPPPPSEVSPPAGGFLEAAGAAAAKAARRLGGLLQDVVEAADALNVASMDGETAGAREKDGPASPPSGSGGDRAEQPEIPAVVDCAAPLRRLEVSQLTAGTGDADLEFSLYRLDGGHRAPEAESITSQKGLDFSGFKDAAAGLIVRMAGGDAPRAREVRIWLRRLQSVADDLAPPALEEDERRFGPPPRREAADPFALFGDMSAFETVCGEGVVQLVLEALAAPGEGPEQVIRRWAAPVACEGGLEAALARLRTVSAPEFAGAGESEADQVETDGAETAEVEADGAEAGEVEEARPSAPEPIRLNGAHEPKPAGEAGLAAPGALDKALTEKIREAPQTEAPVAAAAPSGSEAAAGAALDGSAPVGGEITAPPLAEPNAVEAIALGAAAAAPDEADPAKPTRRPVFFGALVSEARRRVGARGAETNGERGVQGVEGWASTPPIAPRRPSAGSAPPAPRRPNRVEAPADKPAAPPPGFKPLLAPRRPPSAKPPLAPRRPERAQGGDISLLRLELIDADTDRRIASLRDGARLAMDAVLSKRVTVKATLAGDAASAVKRLRVTLEGDQLAQRAVDRPQPADAERVGIFYGLTFQAGEAGLVIEALGDEDGGDKPVFIERRSFRVE